MKDTRDHLRRNVQYENLRYTLKLNGEEVIIERTLNNPGREGRSKRFFARDFIRVDKYYRNTFVENFTMKDAMKLNKQDQVPVPVPIPIPIPIPIPVQVQVPVPVPVPILGCVR